jgi:hypothetical protein
LLLQRGVQRILTLQPIASATVGLLSPMLTRILTRNKYMHNWRKLKIIRWSYSDWTETVTSEQRLSWVMKASAMQQVQTRKKVRESSESFEERQRVLTLGEAAVGL